MVTVVVWSQVRLAAANIWRNRPQR